MKNDVYLDKDTEIADTFMKRFFGLMGRREEQCEKGLLLINCSSIHMMFMRFAIQAVYLDKNFVVLDTEEIGPWRIGKIVKKTKHVYEIPVEKKLNIKPGDRLLLNKEEF